LSLYCASATYLVSFTFVLYDVVVLQTIPVEEHYGSDFTYEVVRRPVSTDNWTFLETLPSEMSSSSYTLSSLPVELAIISKNELGDTVPSTVFRVSSTVLC